MSATIPIYQWTHDGDEVRIVRMCDTDGTSSRGFVYPLTVGATVETPEWDPAPECGGGLHGWPWGLHLGDGAPLDDPSSVFLVLGAAVGDVVSISGKVKIRAGVVRHVGTMRSALAFVAAGRAAWIAHSATTGYAAHSATTGDAAHSATTGDAAHSATTGDAAYSATTGRGAIAVSLSRYGRAKAGPSGAMVLVDYSGARPTPVVALPGEGGIKPDVWYELDGRGNFVEVAQ